MDKVILQTLDKVHEFCRNNPDKNFQILAVSVNDNYGFDVYEIEHLGKYKNYPCDVCVEQSKERVVQHIFTNSFNGISFTSPM